MLEQRNGDAVDARTGGADAAHACEYLSFTIGREEYGIHILQVQELRGYEAVTRIASAPDHLKGVINLRGIIVPIIDMRIRLGVAEPSYDQFTVVVILNLRDRVVGMVVDSVSDVVALTAEQIKAAPEMGGAFSTEHLIGLGTLGDRMIILVDIEKLMSGEEIGLIDSAASGKVAA
ncbi:MAG TPA: chemotaxis protein CheW [Noviherbaspirillum sp.]|uniref:chemotaxis protein CheW n=1 Tax=Noviherbaspirillum sp. TaxID=1926288 RepID=UPI002F95DD35